MDCANLYFAHNIYTYSIVSCSLAWPDRIFVQGVIAFSMAVGKTGRGAEDQWVKPGEWELGDHVNKLCFDSKLEWVKVCPMRSRFLGMLPW